MSEEQFVAETDKSPGVLMASGYIAGGAIAGILIAIMSGFLTDYNTAIEKRSTDYNPFYSTADWNGHRADLLCLIPFVMLLAILYSTGRRMSLAVPPKPGR
jgi:hypothetical protein